MASVTLVESAKLSENEMVAGVIEEIITVSQMYEALPFDDIEGNSLKYNRENALGGAGVTTVGTTIGSGDYNPISAASGTAKNAATFTEVFSGLTTILGDAEVNGMIQATRSNINDQTAVQIASKAKHCGRIFQHMLINGDGTNNTFEGLAVLCAAGQTIAATGGNGDQLTLGLFDALMDLVTAKDGAVDYFAVHARTRREYRALLRALGGAAIMEVVEMPSGEKVIAYGGIPIFRNDYIPINGTVGGSTNATQVFCGTFDDGSRSNGLAGLTARNMAGINVVDVGEKEGADERIWRVKWYAGAALFSEKGLSMATGVIAT